MLPAFFCLLVLVVGVYSVHSAFKYTRMIANIFLSIVYNPPEEIVGTTPAKGQKTVILDSSDEEIETLFFETKGARRAAIFCHESGGRKESWEKYAYFVPALGYHVLSVDLKGDSLPDEKNSLAQWPAQADVGRLHTVIRWVKKALAPEEGIVLFGVSNGADVAFAASFLEPSVKAVVADGLFSMKEIFRDYIRKWGPILVKPNIFGERYPKWLVDIFASLGFWYCQRLSKRRFVDVERLLSARHVPLLMIHGGEDDYISPEHQRFLGNARGRKPLRHVVIPQAGHNEAVVSDRRIYETEITQFLKGT